MQVGRHAGLLMSPPYEASPACEEPKIRLILTREGDSRYARYRAEIQAMNVKAKGSIYTGTVLAGTSGKSRVKMFKLSVSLVALGALLPTVFAQSPVWGQCKFHYVEIFKSYALTSIS